MTLAQHSRRRSWRVRTSAGNCLVVRRLDLEPGEIPDSSSFSRFEIAAWARDPFLWPVLLEMYQAAFGHHVAASDAFWLEDKLEEAFRAGSLVIIPEVDLAGGGGGAANTPAESPEAPEKVEKT